MLEQLSISPSVMPIDYIFLPFIVIGSLTLLERGMEQCLDRKGMM